MKKLLSIILIIGILFTGCMSEIDTNNQINEGSLSQEDMTDELEPWTIKKYLGEDYCKLTKNQKVSVQEYLNQINTLEQEDYEFNSDEIESLYNKLDLLLFEYGIYMPLTSVSIIFDKYPKLFNDEDIKQILELEQTIAKLNESDPGSEDLEELDDELIILLDNKGLEGEEIINQVRTQSIDLARFEVVDGNIIIKDNCVKSKDKITDKEMNDYQLLWKQAKKIVPNRFMDMLKLFVVNTDGVENVLAYVNQENDELTKWRMVLDIKDALDEDGQYIKEYDETIVHEFGHLLTLNATQMQQNIDDELTYVNDEGTTKKDSYLNQFYQNFWVSIFEEHQESVDPMDTEGDSAFAFYEKYQNQFVSDYAATNPEEDIAETFRVFVFTDKPAGKTIKDQKILFMYEDEFLVDLRNNIRTNLGIS